MSEGSPPPKKDKKKHKKRHHNFSDLDEEKLLEEIKQLEADVLIEEKSPKKPPRRHSQEGVEQRAERKRMEKERQKRDADEEIERRNI